MNVQDLHQRYISMWPSQVRIDDSYPTTSGGLMLPALSKAHDDVEDKIDYRTDHWGNIFTHSMFQACHLHARGLLEQGATEMEISAVPLELIERYVVTNLSGEDWEEERGQYKMLGSNQTMEPTR